MMKRVLCAGLIAVLSAAAIASPDWRVHRFEDGRFSVQLPEAPARQKQNLRAESAGAATNNAFSLKTDDGSYMVSYVDSESFDDDRTRIAAILDSTCRGAAANAGSTTLHTESIIRNGFMGRTVRFHGRDGTYFRGLVFLAGTRLYQVYAHGSAEWVAGKDVERFLNSFKMWKQK